MSEDIKKCVIRLLEGERVENVILERAELTWYLDDNEVFEGVPSYSDLKEKMIDGIKTMGGENIHVERRFGSDSEPEVIVFIAPEGNLDNIKRAIEDRIRDKKSLIEHRLVIKTKWVCRHG